MTSTPQKTGDKLQNDSQKLAFLSDNKFHQHQKRSNAGNYHGIYASVSAGNSFLSDKITKIEGNSTNNCKKKEAKWKKIRTTKIEKKRTLAPEDVQSGTKWAPRRRGWSWGIRKQSKKQPIAVIDRQRNAKTSQ